MLLALVLATKTNSSLKNKLEKYSYVGGTMYKKLSLVLLLAYSGQADAMLARAARAAGRFVVPAAAVGCIGLAGHEEIKDAATHLENKTNAYLIEQEKGFLAPLLPFAVKRYVRHNDSYFFGFDRAFMNSTLTDADRAEIAEQYYQDIKNWKEDPFNLKRLYFNELKAILPYIPQEQRAQRAIEWLEKNDQKKRTDNEKDQLCMKLVHFAQTHWPYHGTYRTPYAIEYLPSRVARYFANKVNGISQRTHACLYEEEVYSLINENISNSDARKAVLKVYVDNTLVDEIKNSVEEVMGDCIMGMFEAFRRDFESETDMIETVFGPHEEKLGISIKLMQEEALETRVVSGK